MKKHCKQYTKVFVLALLFLVPKSLKAEVVEQVAAVVNSEVITLHDLDGALAPMRGNKEDAQVRKKVLEDLIDQKLLEQEVKKAKVEVSDDDLRRAIAGVLQRNQMTIDALKEELSAKGISFEAYKEQLKKQIRQNKFLQQNLGGKVQVTDQEVQSYRKKNRSGMDENISVHWVRVFFPIEPNATDKERRKWVRRGEAIADRARKGEDLAELGGKNFKEEGVRLGDLPKDLALVASRMEIGSVSDAVQTPQGVYIVKLLERSTATVAANENKSKDKTDDEIWQEIFNEKMQNEIRNYLFRLRKKAYVEIYE